MADLPAEAFITNLVKLIFSRALTFLTPTQQFDCVFIFFPDYLPLLTLTVHLYMHLYA